MQATEGLDNLCAALAEIAAMPFPGQVEEKHEPVTVAVQTCDQCGGPMVLHSEVVHSNRRGLIRHWRCGPCNLMRHEHALIR